MKNVLVTGGRGFIGFNALQLWTQTNPELVFVSVDAYTYADQYCIDEKMQWLRTTNIPAYTLDFTSSAAETCLESIVHDHDIDTIVHFAAESHVDNSIKNPMAFFQSNVIGTVLVMNIARKFGIRIHVIGTDEVYGMTYPTSHADENAPLRPSSPYSASKLAADMLALSYFHTYGTPVTVSRCTNNFGPFQHDEKFIPTVIRNAYHNKKIPIYGDGNQRRHWISVNEHNRSVMSILQTGIPGSIFNIAPPHSNYLSNLDIATFILSELGKPIDLIDHIEDRPGHDLSYYLYAGRYQSTRPYTDDLRETVKWYTSKYNHHA